MIAGGLAACCRSKGLSYLQTLTVLSCAGSGRLGPAKTDPVPQQP